MSMLVDSWILAIYCGLMAIYYGLLPAVMVRRARNKIIGYHQTYHQTMRTPKPLSFKLWLEPSKEVEKLFRVRVGSRFFRVKGSLGLAVLYLSGQPRRPLVNVLLSMKKNFDAHRPHLLDHAQFYLIRPERLVPVVGYAGRRSSQAAEVVLGLEDWLLNKGPFSHSAADHELMHCVQDRAHNLFDWEWRVDRLWASVRRSGKCALRILFCEVHAMVFGSPLIFAGAIFALFAPVVVANLVLVGR